MNIETAKRVSELTEEIDKFEKMNNELYYTPDIEDIRVGYECEIYMPQDINWENYNWQKYILETKHFNNEQPYFPLTSKIRTPYLTKEQIEAEGWEFKETNKIRYWYQKQSPEKGGNWHGYYIYEAKLIHDPEMNYLKILYSFNAVEDECVFEGECKSINEFRTIMKLLKIK